MRPPRPLKGLDTNPSLAALLFRARATRGTSRGIDAPAHSSNPTVPAKAAPAATPRSYLAERAHLACPDLLERTESAVANGHTQYYFAYDCACVADSIDMNTWNDSTATYDGPPMSEDDTIVIINAFLSSPTIEDAFSEIQSTISQAGLSSVSTCFAK